MIKLLALSVYLKLCSKFVRYLLCEGLNKIFMRFNCATVFLDIKLDEVLLIVHTIVFFLLVVVLFLDRFDLETQALQLARLFLYVFYHLLFLLDNSLCGFPLTFNVFFHCLSVTFEFFEVCL